MAKLNGLELKKVTRFKGHEGEPLIQADVYYNDKKVGYYSEDSWGGPEMIEVSPEVEAIFKDFRDENAGKESGLTPEQLSQISHMFTGISAAISALQTMMENEKEFTKVIKKGYGGVMIWTHDGGYATISLPKPNVIGKTDEQIIDDVVKAIPSLKSVDKSDLAVYRSIDQFVVNK